MKNIHKQRRYTLGIGIFALTAILTLQVSAALFDDGGTNTITADIDYNDLLVVGSFTPENTLNILNDAVVGATQLILGENDGSSNNTLNVIGNSLLVVGDANTNGLSGGVVVGSSDNSAEVKIRLGSSLNTENLYVGNGVSDSGKIELTGAGSQINVASNVVIGNAGSDNSVIVSSGTTMQVGGDVKVGDAGSSNNKLNVSGNLLVNSTDNILVTGSNNDINIQSNGKLQVAGDMNTTALDGLGVNFIENGKLEVGGQLSLKNNEIDSGLGIILNNDLSTNHTASFQIVSGTFFNIGDTTSGNSLTLTNGATATTATDRLNIGNSAAADNNTLSIGGTGSSFVSLNETIVGVSGEENILQVNDGGQANLIGDLYIGKNSTANGNKVLVGSNATLNAFSNVIVGDNGSGNTFSINHGTVSVANGNDFVLGSASGNNRYNQIGGTNTVSGKFIIGKMAAATGTTGFVDDDAVETTGNLAIIGTDATLNLQDLTVGLEGGGSIMTIRDGGKVNVDGDVVIGEAVGDNYIYLQRDSTTQFNVTDDLIVGKEGDSNRFAAYGGTANIGGNLYLGASTNQHDIKNFIHVETTNAVINVANAIYIGASNSVNTLDLVGGATVTAQELFVGNYSGVSNNVVTVTGEESLLFISNNVTVGAGGNSIIVQNDGWLAIGESTTTNLPSSSGGAISVGNGSGTASLSVGENSSIEAGNIYLGIGTNDTGLVTITGSNSQMTASQNIVVGLDGSSNTLTIAEGATAEGDLIIGQNAGANDNEVIISGAASSLLADSIMIGSVSNSGNTLVLTNGALFTLSDSLNIASNNTLDVNAGATFRVENDFDLIAQSTNGFNFNSGSTLEVGGLLTATNVLEGSRNIVLDGGQWNVGTNLIIGANSDSNSISIKGAGSILTATDVAIGSTNSLGNILLIANEGGLTVEESLFVANGNTLNLASNGTLTVNGDLDVAAAAPDTFIFGNDTTLEVGGTLTTAPGQKTIENGQTVVIGLSTNRIAQWNVGDDLSIGGAGGNGELKIQFGGVVDSLSSIIGNVDSNKVSISGLGSTWNITGDLTLGDASHGNEFTIAGGATNMVSDDAFIGNGIASNNSVLVSGANSFWDIGMNLTIGGSALNGGNLLQVSEGAHASIGADLALKNGSKLIIGTNSTVNVAGDYTQDETSILDVTAWRDTEGSLVVGSDATFSNNTTIAIRGDGTISDNPFEYIVVEAGDLQLGTSNSLDSINIDLFGFADGSTNFIFDNKLIVRGNADSLSSIIGAEEGTQLGNISAEIDGFALKGSTNAISMRRILIAKENSSAANEAMDNYYGEKSSSTPANNLVNLGIQSVAQQITMRADTTRSRMGGASASPNGAAGPHESGQELQGWISAYAARADQSGSGGFNSYDASISGFMIGVDLSVAENVLVGVAGGTGSTSIDKDNDADADTKTKFVSVYTSMGTTDWFLDSSIIYGNSTIDSTLGSTFDTEADYDAKNVAIYIGGGKEISGEYLIFTPQASLLGNYYKQDAYTEDATTAVARDIDSFNAFYLQSSLGASLGFYTMMGDVTLKPEIRIHWLHEWNADEESLDYSLVGGANNYSMKLQAPEEDIIKLGIGTTAKLGDYLELRADFDTRQGSDYSDYTIQGSLRYQF